MDVLVKQFTYLLQTGKYSLREKVCRQIGQRQLISIAYCNLISYSLLLSLAGLNVLVTLYLPDKQGSILLGRKFSDK